VPQAATNSAPTATGFRRVAMNSERGWSMVERSGAMVLARRHPLTIEGDDLGHFDVVFGCGESANEFVLGYSETRRGRNGEMAQPLKEIAIRLGSRTLPLSLATPRTKPEADTGKPGPTSFASGVIPAALLKTFGNTGSRSLTVETATMGKESTMIRIGNTGVAQHLPQLAASCASQPRIEHARLFPQD
jgi:hypothetical protein